MSNSDAIATVKIVSWLVLALGGIAGLLYTFATVMARPFYWVGVIVGVSLLLAALASWSVLYMLGLIAEHILFPPIEPVDDSE